jgi:hypothetical protein
MHDSSFGDWSPDSSNNRAHSDGVTLAKELRDDSGMV